MGKIVDTLLGRNEKQRARIERAKADYRRSRAELRERVESERHLVFRHQHVQAPENPSDGDVFWCECGVGFQFVDLHDGQPGEWESISRA